MYFSMLVAIRADQVRRNFVPGKRLPSIGVGRGGRERAGRSGIVDRVRPIGEVAGALLCGQDVGGAGVELAFEADIVGEKEERLVVSVVELRKHDRTAEGEAELILLQHILQ